MAIDYDYLIVGSGAGGSAAAFHLAKSGQQIRLLEKGGDPPKDGSVLPRSSRVDPALSLYAWSLRVSQCLLERAHASNGQKP